MGTNYEELIRGFAGVRVAVIGDLMLDRYVAGRVQRISPEAPVPIVEAERTFDRVGGAGNVATNTQRLGAPTTIIGTVGADADGQRIKEILAASELSTDTVVDVAGHQTTVKMRVIAQGQQIVRIDSEEVQPIEGDLAAAVLAQFEAIAADLVILSDYAKGVLSRSVCEAVIQRARTLGLPVIVDPKGRDYRRYRGATAITPNQIEAAQAIGAESAGAADLSALQHFFLGDLQLDAALITQGERGMTLLLPQAPPRSFPATAREVADVTGAGDTAVSTFALSLAAGATYAEAAFLANIAAGLAVGRSGAVAINPAELIEAIPGHGSGRLHRAR